MLDFISIPLVVGIVTLGIYKLFELFARKKERLSLIEKIGEKFDPSFLESKFSLPIRFGKSGVFSTLKMASLLLGVGLGLLVGFLFCYSMLPGYGYGDFSNDIYEIAGIVYGAAVLLFGGLGLLIAFVIELKYMNKKKGE